MKDRLTYAQAERLAVLIEDCGEIVTAATKIMRHGYESTNPDDPGAGTNRHQLEQELGDGAPVGTWREVVLAAMDGRELRLRDIYRAAEGTAKVREAKAKQQNFLAQIRRTLQLHCVPVARGVWRPV